MRYSTIVEKNDKTLLEIIDMLEQFEKDKFIAGLQMRHYSQFQIEQTLDMVRSYQARMNIGARALAHFSENFIQQFATDNNKCFKEAQRYFNRIRSMLCALKKVFQMTCRKSMVQLPEGTKDPSVFERSPLGGGGIHGGYVWAGVVQRGGAAAVSRDGNAADGGYADAGSLSPDDRERGNDSRGC